jgi:hypothetical protein
VLLQKLSIPQSAYLLLPSATLPVHHHLVANQIQSKRFILPETKNMISGDCNHQQLAISEMSQNEAMKIARATPQQSPMNSPHLTANQIRSKNMISGSCNYRQRANSKPSQNGAMNAMLPTPQQSSQSSMDSLQSQALTQAHVFE